MKNIKRALKGFEHIDLSGINKVKLMNRVDFKYCFHFSKLKIILDELATDYFILEIANQIVQPYSTIYFDTPNDEMYLAHQNGKRNRHKIRIRKYETTNTNFLEVKHKNNKGRTIKKRINTTTEGQRFTSLDHSFLNETSPYRSNLLEQKVKNRFFRITLISKTFDDRITIDTLPLFKNKKNEILLRNLVIIEVKQGKYGLQSKIREVLKKHNIREQRFSKYCIGRALLENDLKKNRFKPSLLKINQEFI